MSVTARKLAFPEIIEFSCPADEDPDQLYRAMLSYVDAHPSCPSIMMTKTGWSEGEDTWLLYAVLDGCDQEGEL